MNGETAAEAGLPTVPPTAMVGDGYDEINLTRDLLVARVAWVDVAPPGEWAASKVARYSTEGRLQSLYPATGDDVATATYVLDAIAGFPQIAQLPAILAALTARIEALEKKPPK